jgi:chromosome segregation ATPase
MHILKRSSTVKIAIVNYRILYQTIVLLFLQKLRDDTTDRKKDLEQLETLGQWLSDQAPDEPSVVANVEMQKTKLAKKLDEQQRKIDEKYMELQDILMHGQEFDANCEDLEEKLGDLESKFATLRPVSAVYDTVKIQEIDGQSLKEDLEKYEPVYKNVVEEGEKLVEDMGPGDEKDALAEKLSDLKTR